MGRYYIVYNPITLDLMHLMDQVQDVTGVISDLTGREYSQINHENFPDFLKFNLNRRKKGMTHTLGLESKAADYIANQIAKIEPFADIILADGDRRRLEDIIAEHGKPGAVFITAMSANFPVAALTALVLNHGKIPVLIGGVHVSASKMDMDLFVRKYAPYPRLVSQVTGPGDSMVFSDIMAGLNQGDLKPEYLGSIMIEDGIWGAKNIEHMAPMNPVFLKKFPLVGPILKILFRINPIAPYLGCPFSCNFCSISTIPVTQRKFVARSAKDFVDELKFHQRKGATLDNRIYFFLPDNLLLGNGRLEEILNLIIQSDLVINYAAQISIDVAQRPDLLEKLRASGATHFFIGFESLNLDNLKFIGKNIVPAIEKSGKSVPHFYADMIRTIQGYGISIHGAFIFGLPHDRFDSLENHTGRETADFCKKNHIGLQGCQLTDLPGSKNFELAQQNKSFVYGAHGSMGYFLSLCVSDLSECNRKPPENLFHSMLVVLHLTYQAIQQVGSTLNILKTAFFAFRKAARYPTKNGSRSLKQRFIDACIAASAQIVVNNLFHAEETVRSRPDVKGAYERYFAREKDARIKSAFAGYVQQF
ncbi:MAG: hypothetical protein FP812_18985, partial [Desulfobacula sp.]|nr:hypothetical protein [Desulfobacula sp.]